MAAEAINYEEKVRELNALREALAQKERDLAAARKETLEHRKDATRHPHCEKIINNYSLISAAVGLLPVPGLDVAALTGIQIKMIDSLAEQFGRNYTEAEARHTLTALGGSVAALPIAGPAVATAVMAVPFVGGVLSFAARPAAAAASTRMVGRLALERLERDEELAAAAGGGGVSSEVQPVASEQAPPSSQ